MTRRLAQQKALVGLSHINMLVPVALYVKAADIAIPWAYSKTKKTIITSNTVSQTGQF